MALDTINPCESPAGWKAIRTERYLNAEVAKFSQTSLCPRREANQDVPDSITLGPNKLILFHRWKLYTCPNLLSQCWCFPTREKCQLCPIIWWIPQVR